MTRRLGRLSSAVLLACLLTLWYSIPLPTAVSSTLPEQPLPAPARIYQTYWAAGQPVLKDWLTAEAFLYNLGLQTPQPYEDSLYIDPAFEAWILRMRPALLESARRHNHPELTHMDDRQFAVVLAAILYL